MTEVVTTVTNGVVHQSTFGPSGTPHDQATADTILSQPVKSGVTAAPMPGAGQSDSGSGLTLAQFEQLISDLTPEQQAAARAEAGLARVSPHMAAGAETGRAGGLPTTPDERTKMASAYEFPVLDPTGEHGQASHQLDAELRDTLARGGFERGPGSFIIQEAARFAPQWQAMPEPARELHRRHQTEILKRTWGAEFDANMQLTAAFVDSIGGDAWHYLGESGAGANAMVIQQIFARAQRMRAGFDSHRQSRKGN
jgi:hypothetical protein